MRTHSGHVCGTRGAPNVSRRPSNTAHAAALIDLVAQVLQDGSSVASVGEELTPSLEGGIDVAGETFWPAEAGFVPEDLEEPLSGRCCR